MKTRVGTIDCTPKWSEVAATLAHGAVNGDADAQRELQRMATLADTQADLAKRFPGEDLARIRNDFFKLMNTGRNWLEDVSDEGCSSNLRSDLRLLLKKHGMWDLD